MLHVSKSLSKGGLRVLKTARSLAQQVICRSIQSVPEEQRPNINSPTSPRRATPSQQRDEMLDMFFKNFRVHNAISCEHGPDKLA